MSDFSVRIPGRPGILSFKGLSPEESAAIDRAAAAAGTNRSDWARTLLRGLDARAADAKIPASTFARLVVLAAAAQTTLADELAGARDRHLAMVEGERARLAAAE